MIKFIDGDILSPHKEGERIIIAQQVNAQGVMGSGLAKQIRDKYPIVYYQYKKHCESIGLAKRYLLGEVLLTYPAHDIIVANLFGQYDYGREDILYTDYAALETALETVMSISSTLGATLRIPYGIGCGLAHGDWNIVYKMIEDTYNRSGKDLNIEIWRKS